jgi:spore germination cell wall hydrolase CwlJ-like protein
VINKQTKDVVRGATHYHTTRVQPHWAEKDKQVRRIAKHVFYAGIL